MVLKIVAIDRYVKKDILMFTNRQFYNTHKIHQVVPEKPQSVSQIVSTVKVSIFIFNSDRAIVHMNNIQKHSGRSTYIYEN